MSELKATSSAEIMPEQALDKGQGFLRTIGEKLGQMPALREAIKAGALLSLLGGSASLQGCDVESGNSHAVGSEKAGQGYEVVKAALTADEMKALSTPKAVAGTEVGDGSPEFGEVDGKKVMTIGCVNVAKNKVLTYYKAGSSLKELMTQGTFAELKGLQELGAGGSVRAATIYKNKIYFSVAGGTFDVFEADIKFNANNELETSNFKGIAGIGGGDIKIIEMDGTPYLYLTDSGGSWKNQRKEITPDLAAPVEDLGIANFNGNLPSFHNGMWIGNRMVNSGGQNVSKAYWSSTFQGVATSSTAVSKFNVGVQANTGDLAVAEDDERVVLVGTKWNSGFPTSVVFSEYVKPPVVKPDPAPDAGTTEVDAGPSGTDAADTAEVAEDVGQELPPPIDTVDATEVAEDIGQELPPPIDTVDATEVAEDVGQELPPPIDTVDATEVAEDIGQELPTPIDTVDATEVAEDVETELSQQDVMDGELPPPDAQSEITPADIAAEIAAEIQEDSHADDGSDASETAQDLGMTELPKEDVAIQPETTPPDSSKPDASTQPDTSGNPDVSQNSDSVQGSDGLQQQDSSKKPDVGSNPPVVKDGCSASPRKSPWGANALAASILAAVIAVYSRRRTMKKL